MIEVDHNVAPEPQPAKPILASQLLELEEKQRTRFTRDNKRERLSTACSEIDELLGGQGVERGIVVGISAEGGESRLISLNILASILLSHLPTTTSTPRATIIDTIGSFPLTLLAKLIKSRITAERASPNFVTGNVEPDIDADVLKCLDMIGISRVFDLEGLWEVLGEVGRAPDDAKRAKEVPSKPPVLEIANSDDEDEDEILASPRQNQDYSIPKERVDSGVEIIIIDTLSHIINELFSRKEKSDAHTLLALLSQSLTTLSQTSNILTILHNNVVPSTSISKAPPQSSLHYHPPPQQGQQPRAQKQSSTLFPSNPTKPALGQIFSQFPSLHLSLSKLPKLRRDAEVLYGGDEDPEALGLHEERNGVGYCTVIEVLKDETPNLGVGKEERWFGMREGGWCAVDVRDDGVRFESAFGMALEKRGKEKVHGVGRGEFGGGVGTVSSVAKAWGFGGRRV